MSQVNCVDYVPLLVWTVGECREGQNDMTYKFI